ncbi:GDSL-type esterase/lipase family protein [Thermomonas carbonis]|uniref:Cupin domain-containing protein n=1 Tax=Thermomonas carbonis TaxID=1463158 RepID=A0A7G9STG5_9GAMM|nr:GDSL-type esterase/lipase family protein [Thermomonas carbonis]QNN71140.1 cupin domain-containing protein [Thermomonas carbonis]
MRILLLILAVLLAMSSATAEAQSPKRVFIVGDSTASEYGSERAPRQGWGMQLQSFLDPAAWQVKNHAQSGRSSRSFIDEGWLKPVEASLTRGNVLLIQFGHNDEKAEDPTRYNEPAQAFPQWLMRYVALAREKGATPILITPLARRKFERGSKIDQLLDTHGAYSIAVRELAKREQVGLIDLDAASTAWLRALGDDASKPFYMHVPEQKLADDTHLQARGATAVACLVVGAWKTLDPALAKTVVRDTDCGARDTALADRAAQAHPSQVVHEADIARQQPGPHGGAGTTTAYPFFADAPGLSFFFRKRVLHKGAGIGMHQHDKDEVYYVVSGKGRYIMDGTIRDVGPGDAMLTRTGSTHSLMQAGEDDLVILLAYPKAAN